MDTAGGFCQVTGPAPLDNAFHQLSLTYDAEVGLLNVYLDGVANPHPWSCTGPLAMPAANLSLGGFTNQLFL